MEKVVRVGVAVNIDKEGNYLLLKRKSELGTDTWCAPGGKIEIGESIYDCAMRELHEEVGDDIQVTEPVFYGITNDFFEKEQQHYITIHTICFYISGEPKINEPNKCSEIGWFHQDDVLDMDLFLPTLNFITNSFETGDDIKIKDKEYGI